MYSVLPLSLLALVASVTAQGSSYAPVLVSCPSSSLITKTGSPIAGDQQLPTQEQAYMTNRRQNVLPSLWQSYLNNASTGTTGYNTSIFTSGGNYPRLGTAVSGGGLRASLYAAGTLSALDSRNGSSTLGGLLQLSDYLTGLSGGSWTVGSFSLNDMPDLFSMVLGLNGQSGWLLNMNIITPDGTFGVADNLDYLDNIRDDVRLKAESDFPVSIVDLWGRALIYHFANGTTSSNFYEDSAPHASGLQWGSIRYVQNFQSGALPFPIIVTTSRISASNQLANTSDTTIIPLSNTVFEISPYTFGSFDPTLQATIPIDYAGTYLNNGSPINSSACVNNFDNAGFMIGSSAALFAGAEQALVDSTFLQIIGKLSQDIADLGAPNFSVPLVANFPNSFRNYVPSSSTTFESAGNDILQITDGGLNGENVPLAPLLVKERNIDVIIAADSSADTQYNWPNGTSLIATAARVSGFLQGNWTNFPPIPSSADVFVNQGLNLRPTFFGCNTTGSGNTSTLGNYPLVIYLPNAPPLDSNGYSTNTSTYKLEYSTDDQVSFLEQAQRNALKGFQTGSSSSDPQWPLCLKCAIVDRARKRARVERTSECAACMDKYCWAPNQQADTLPSGTGSLGGGGSSRGGGGGTSAGVRKMPLSRLSLISALVAAVLAYLA